MNYRQAMEYVGSIAGQGIVPGLDSIKELCRRLGDPQKAVKWVHVAGTNGKGSTLAYVSTILSKAGYRVGRYVSPTIREYRERIQIGGKMISQKDLAEGKTLVKEACDGMVEAGLPQPTPFEVETALAFWYFQKKACDLGVLEVGMGGLLDATNIIEGTLVEIIVSIGMDHMKFLGNSLEKIASQKAGIINPGSTVVVMDQKEEVLKVMKKKAEEVGARLVISDASKATKVRYGLEKQSFYYGNYGKLEIPLAGKFQIDNAVLAVNACAEIARLGYKIPEEAIRRGLAETRWDGRLTVIQKKPLFVIDGAHNEDAAEKLSKSIEFYFTNRRIIYIMGVLKDKDYDRIIELTEGFADQIITITPPENPRALPALDLAKEIAKVHPSVTAAESLEDAVEMARLLAGKDDVILAFGSLSYLGKLMDIVGYGAKNKPKRNGRG
ncbi:MAG: bifunctional folylpolyglutamate synthase/dihydrofolate synthase [Lachnospiraceae bacterium]|nr:bifunctional folylpolyglutamate synthase/dihydrofolate synthase [Lachnospiraceae bacterium]